MIFGIKKKQKTLYVLKKKILGSKFQRQNAEDVCTTIAFDWITDLVQYDVVEL